jgi:hypothetical protein
MPHNAKATYGGMVYSDMELMVVLTNPTSGEGVVASPVLVLERLRGQWCGSLLFGRRPYVGLRVGLTEGWRSHNSGYGDVLSSWAPTRLGWYCSARDGGAAAGMAAQGRSWQRRRAPLVQRHDTVPCERGVGVHTLFEGSAVPFRGVWHVDRTGVGGTVSQS